MKNVELDGNNESTDKEKIEFLGEEESAKDIGDFGDALELKKEYIHRVFDAHRLIAGFAAFNMAIGAFLMLCYYEHTNTEYVILLFLTVLCVSILISEAFDDGAGHKFCGCLYPVVFPNWIMRGEK